MNLFVRPQLSSDHFLNLHPMFIPTEAQNDIAELIFVLTELKEWIKKAIKNGQEKIQNQNDHKERNNNFKNHALFWHRPSFSVHQNISSREISLLLRRLKKSGMIFSNSILKTYRKTGPFFMEFKR